MSPWRLTKSFFFLDPKVWEEVIFEMMEYQKCTWDEAIAMPVDYRIRFFNYLNNKAKRQQEEQENKKLSKFLDNKK
jgi:hypothetical protein